MLTVLALRCLREPGSAAALAELDRGLSRFSAIGPAVVAVLLATGAVNVWVLAGPSRLLGLAGNAWGVALLIKLGLFAAMLALAGVNRWRLGPALARGDPGAAAALRLNLAAEAALGILVIVAVSWLGTLPPPSAL